MEIKKYSDSLTKDKISFIEEMEEISGDRGKEYGPADESFNRIAELWTQYYGPKFTGRDVAIMMILLKVGRLSENINHHDSYIDIANYAKLADELK